MRSIPVACLSFAIFLPLGSAAQPSVTVTTITQTFTDQTATTQPLSPQWSDDLTFRTSVLNSTNLFRYEHSASYLYWNRTLATFAASHASHCRFAHSGGPYGENLALGYEDVTSSVDAWGNERADYDFSSSSPTGFSEKTGHFTQLVWKATQSVGCGWVDCTGRNGLNGVFLVCEYDPAGNVVGENNQLFVENVEGERKSGESGFDELAATRGATGGVPSASSSSGSGPTTSASSSAGTGLRGEAERAKEYVTTVGIVLSTALLLGFGVV